MITMSYSYIHKTKVHLLVLMNFVHQINARNVEHVKLICVSPYSPYFVICRISPLC